MYCLSRLSIADLAGSLRSPPPRTHTHTHVGGGFMPATAHGQDLAVQVSAVCFSRDHRKLAELDLKLKNDI